MCKISRQIAKSIHKNICIWYSIDEFEVSKRQAYFPNLDTIAFGYDAFLGNPHMNGKDPGIKGKIFQLEYLKQQRSADGRWLIPDGVDVCLHTVPSTYFLIWSPNVH